MWNVRVQRLIRATALLATTIAVLAALVWLFADAPARVQPAKAKMFYTTHQLRSEAWPWNNWLALLGGVLTTSLIGVPSGLQFACLFPFVPPIKAWAFLVIAQVFSTWAVLRRYFGRPLPESASALRESASNAGDPLRLSWALRFLLGLPNRTIDLALAARTDAANTPRRLALWSLPGHCVRLALVGLWIHAIALLITDFRPFPEHDFALAGIMTVIISAIWLLPWIPELLPGGTPVQTLVTVCAGADSPPSTDAVPASEAPAAGSPAATKG